MKYVKKWSALIGQNLHVDDTLDMYLSGLFSEQCLLSQYVQCKSQNSQTNHSKN